MILLVDVGNSWTKWRTQRGGRILARGRFATRQCADVMEAWRGLSPEAACISSVAGDAVNRVIRDALSLEPHWLKALPGGHGVVNHYSPPESLGPDRYAALVGACRGWPGDQVVVGVGTALTADMLTAEGHFLGGCIAPGPQLMLSALEGGTAGVRGGVLRQGEACPRNTASAVGEGIGLALRGVVEGMRDRLRDTVGHPPRVLLSGGGRQVLRPLLNGEVVEVEELVLEGLAWIARDLGYDA